MSSYYPISMKRPVKSFFPLLRKMFFGKKNPGAFEKKIVGSKFCCLNFQGDWYTYLCNIWNINIYIYYRYQIDFKKYRFQRCVFANLAIKWSCVLFLDSVHQIKKNLVCLLIFLGAWLAMWPDVKLCPVFLFELHHGKKARASNGFEGKKEKKKQHKKSVWTSINHNISAYQLL